MQQSDNPPHFLTSRYSTLSIQIGLSGLYIFAFGAWLNSAVALLGSGLMLFSVLLEARAVFNTVRHSVLLWFVISFCAYVTGRTVVAMYSDPANSVLHLEDGARFFCLSGFMLVAWHMAADQKRMLRVFITAFAGFLIARLWYFDWSFSSSVPWWQLRQGLGLPEIAFGYYAATALFGLLIFAPRLYRRLKSPSTVIGVGLLWLALIAMTLQGVAFSQSRSVLLSMVPVALAILYAGRSYFRSVLSRHRLVLAAIGIVVIAALLHFNSAPLVSRMLLEQQTYAEVMSGSFDNIRSADEQGQVNNVGARLVLYKIGIDHWLNKPLFGEGPAASKIILHNSEAPISQLNDLHNGPIDILVRYGFVGLAVSTLCLWVTLCYGWRAWRQKQLDADMALFLACGMALILLSMFTNFRMLNYDWRYWMFLFSGACASYGMRYYSDRSGAGEDNG